MASNAVAGAARRVASSYAQKLAASRPTGVSKIHTSAPKAAGGGHHDDPNAYIHATHMYDIPAMTNRKLKFGLGVWGAVAFGTAVPLIAVWHQQIKARG